MASFFPAIGTIVSSNTFQIHYDITVRSQSLYVVCGVIPGWVMQKPLTTTRHSEVTRVLVAMFTVSQRVTGTSSGGSSRKPVSSSRKQPQKKKLKGALVSVASKNWFTVLDAILPTTVTNSHFPVLCVCFTVLPSSIDCFSQLLSLQEMKYAGI